ncbi:dipeptide transport system permease DppC [Klebsiella michiganensis]|uniref:Dipeptide transport system permease DppC n=1 Tax=Klebsiella michiganensis TaxID=1134687 RepID=A0A7H4N552_9ENTR|nr:dipeptide transport system permease DppC [Klebsiella michiganensis]
MRFTDVVMSMPRLILAFAFVAMLGPGLVNGALALALTTWPAYARQARSEIQRLRHSDYLAAAEMMGIRGWRLLIGHILPLCLPSAIVRLALDLAGIILAAAGSRLPWPRRPPANGGMGRDDRRRHAGHFRPVVDRRRPWRRYPDRQPGV